MLKRVLPVTLLALVVLLILAACGGGIAPPEGDPSAATATAAYYLTATYQAGQQLPQAVEAARNDLAQKLGIPASQVEVRAYQTMNWNDSCLGLGAADESCAQTTTPGYDVDLYGSGKAYDARTDQTGGQVRYQQSVP